MSIRGTGIDIVEIDRIKKAIERNPKFLNRVFTEYEIEYFTNKNNNYYSIAGNFAAKEAVLKALGTGLVGIEWKNIEVLHESTGKPKVNLNGKAKEILENNNINSISISISHEKKYAVAIAIAE